MGKNSTISVITVTFNAGKFLEATIKSIAPHISDDVEYIIIDGQSTDNTLDIIQKNKQYITKYISEPDEGLYDAMNKGINISTGNYLWFLNAGDRIYDENTIPHLLSAINEATPDVLYGGTMIIDAEGHEIGIRRQQAPEQLSWKDYKKGMVVCHQSFIVNRAMITAYDLKYPHSADIDWQIKCLKKAVVIYNTRIIISRFLEGGRSRHTILPSLKERFIIMKKNFGLIRSIFFHFPIAVRFVSFLILNRRF